MHKCYRKRVAALFTLVFLLCMTQQIAEMIPCALAPFCSSTLHLHSREDNSMNHVAEAAVSAPSSRRFRLSADPRVDALPSFLLPGLQVSFFLFIVFVVYTMLPFSMRGAIFASAITCLSHTATLSICLASKVTELEPLVWQVRRKAPLREKPEKEKESRHFLIFA